MSSNRRNNSDASQIILDENLASPCDLSLLIYFVVSCVLFGIGFKITFFSLEEDRYWVIGPFFLLCSAMLATQSLLYIRKKNAQLLDNREASEEFLQETIEPEPVENRNSYQNLNNLNVSPPPYPYLSSNIENFENFVNSADANANQSNEARVNPDRQLNHRPNRYHSNQALNFDSNLLIDPVDQSNERLLERPPRTAERNFDRTFERNQYQNLNLINNPLTIDLEENDNSYQNNINISPPPSYTYISNLDNFERFMNNSDLLVEPNVKRVSVPVKLKKQPTY